MIKSKRGLVVRIIAFCSVPFFSVACSKTWNSGVGSVDLPRIDRLPLLIELQLADSLCESKWEKKSPGLSIQMPIGNGLCRNARAVAVRLFSEVWDPSKGTGERSDAIDALLAIELIAVERTRPITGFGDQSTLLRIQWTLLDGNKKLIWVGTATGEGHSPMGYFSAKKNAAKQLTTAVHTAFRSSFDQMSTSPEIRDFASRVALDQESDPP
jgi:hypothetical protein